MAENTQWVNGFLFRDEKEVVLVLKNRPDWQKGKMNGLGGKIEKGESALEAMRREFLEEAGVAVDDWREFAQMQVQGGVVHFFVAHGDYPIKTVTDEKVGWYRVAELQKLPILENLKWLIPLAFDRRNNKASIEYLGK